MTSDQRAPSGRIHLRIHGTRTGSRVANPRWPSRHRSDLILLSAIAIVALAVRAIPILIGGGLAGLHGYDDGVYFGAAIALVHGLLPYRDYLLLQPPGMVVALSPLAALGDLMGDAAAFGSARFLIMVLGALNAVLVAIVAGRGGRLAGLTAGVLYAVWITAADVERGTDLHGPQATLLLLGLLALARPGRIETGRAALAGVALGLATTVQLWQGVSVAVIFGWLILQGRGEPWLGLRPALAFVGAAGLAFGLLCLPFFAAAPEAMIRYTLVDQLGRPSTGVGTIERLSVLEGLPMLRQLPSSLRHLIWDPAVLAVAASGLALVVLTAWRRPWSRLWAALALVQTAVVLVTPSFYLDYPGFVAPAATLVLGTGLAAGVEALARRGVRPRRAQAPVVALLVLLGVFSLARLEGRSLQLGALEQDISEARCVTADSASLLVLTSALRRDLDAGCRLVLDPTGYSYDADRGRLRPGPVGLSRQHAAGYQQAMVDWYTSGDAALFVRQHADGLTPATDAAIERRLPVERRRGPVTVRLAAPP